MPLDDPLRPTQQAYGPSHSSLRTSSESEYSADALQDHIITNEGSVGRFASIPFVERNAGLLLVAFSQLFFALMHASVQILNRLDPPISALQLVVVRMVLTYVCCVAYMLCKRVPDPILGPSGVRLLLVFRGFSGFFRVFGVYYSLQYLSLSDATVLTFLSPLSTAFAGHFFLGEAYSWKEGAAGVLSLIGVVLIARPRSLFGGLSEKNILRHSSQADAMTFAVKTIRDIAEGPTHSQRLLAVGVGLIGVAGATGVYTLIRAIGNRAHPLHSLSFFSSHCVIAGSIGMIIVREPFVFPFHLTWIALFLLVTVFGFLAQVFLTMGLQREAAGRGTLAIYVQIVFASILEQILFHTVPSMLSAAGTIIILGSGIYVALTKHTTQSQVLSENHGAEGDEIVHMEMGDTQPVEDFPSSRQSARGFSAEESHDFELEPDQEHQERERLLRTT